MAFDDIKRKNLAAAMRTAAGNGRAAEFYADFPASFINMVADEVEKGESDLARMFLAAHERDRARLGKSFDEYIAHMSTPAAAGKAAP
jgi:hypothetical protein